MQQIGQEAMKVSTLNLHQDRFEEQSAEMITLLEVFFHLTCCRNRAASYNINAIL